MTQSTKELRLAKTLNHEHDGQRAKLVRRAGIEPATKPL